MNGDNPRVAAPETDEIERQLLAGTSAAMREVVRLVRAAAAHTVPVLLQGPSGCGKEHVARAIHGLGVRRNRPFITVNCAALSETLLDTELFGHRRGAFSGAIDDHPGLFARAHRGTLFLDEIGDASPALQIRLLRCLESGEISAVGCDRGQSVDVRVLAATHRHLGHAMHDGTFRADLYYRISTLVIAIPALAERLADLPAIAAHLLYEHSARIGKTVPGFRAAALASLASRTWSGNLRELSNEIERAVALAVPGEPIDTTLLSSPRPPSSSGYIAGESPSASTTQTLRQARQQFERQYIRQVLRQLNGNASAAAKVLGLSRSMLQRKIRSYQLRD